MEVGEYRPRAVVPDPQITVLVPSIGRMDFLPEAKRSLSQQTRNDIRVLILDNASPIEAQEFFRAWERDDARVTVMRSDDRIPMFSNFNRGMRAVETPLVTFVHDDDVYHPRYLEVLAGALERAPSAAFAGSNYDFVDETGEVIEERRWIKADAHWSGRRYIEEVIGRSRNPIPMPGLVFRRAAFGPDGFDETLPIHFGDFVLLMRAAERDGMLVCKERVVGIRKHSGQASRMLLSKSIRLRTEVVTAYLDELERAGSMDAQFITMLRSRVEAAQRIGLLWGWLSSPESSERAACLESLPAARSQGMIRYALGLVDRAGLHPPPVGPRLAAAARRAAQLLRM